MNLEERKLKKRMISLLLCLCMVFSLLPTVVLAEGESVESNQMSGEVCQGVTWEYDTESKTLTVNGVGLITLDDKSGNTHPWDAFKAEIEHLVIDEGITGTGSIKVFAELSALRTVQFPETLITLATGTFATDTALSSVVLPETIESIGSVVFSMCTGLTSLTIQNRTMTVSAEEYWSSDNRKAPDGLTVYGYKWKSDEPKEDTNLTDFYRYVQWQNENNGGSIQFVALDVTEAAKGGLIKNATGSSNQIYWAFNDATNTLTVSGTGDINWDDSENCYKGGENPPWNDYKSQIENLVIGEGITGTSRIKIFANLANLKNIQFPSTFTQLYSGAFASCGGLESVTLPEQLVSMSDVVFSNCNNLKTLVVKNRALKTPTSGNWSTGKYSDQPGNNLPTDLTVYGYRYTDDSKTTATPLYQYVQWQNSGRPKGDTQEINFVAFDDDTSASSGIIVGSNNILWVFDKNTKTLTVSGEGNITWDATLYKVGDNPPWAAFIPQIEKLVIGEGITGSSETKLFANLTCLKQISFPSTFTSMGDGTFATASALENVVIPATVTKMGPVVFSACDNLKSLTVLNRTMQITNVESDWTTANRPALQNLTVYGYKWKPDDKTPEENLTDIYKYVQYNNEQGGKITFVAQDESDWTPIDDTGISWRYDATTKTLYLMGSGEIKLVGDQYKGGDNPPWNTKKAEIENLVIGEGITGTGTLKIFSSLLNLKNVSFPSTFTKLAQGTFATCTSLERIVLPDTINSMSGAVFSRCNAMTSLVVKNRNLSVPVETEWSSDKTIPQNLTVYGYRYTDDMGSAETKLYQYVQWQNKTYNGTINFVAFDDQNATAGQIGNSDTYWRYDPDTTTLFITGKGMIPGGSSGNYPWQAYADKITNLVIGDGVTGTEATKALAELYKLRSITFGKDFAILGAGAFANIQTLTQLTLPETITTFGSFPFSGCYGMTELRVECRNIQVTNVNSYWNGSEEQALPKNLTVYGYRCTDKGGSDETAFYKYITNAKNTGIKFVDLDEEAELLGDIRWNYDSSAKKLTISGKGTVPAVRGGTAWNRYASEIEEIEIEKVVTSIAAGAFTEMPKLKTVTINRTVTNIAADAFDTSSSNLTIKAKRNSAAKAFAKEHNIQFKEIVTANILFIGNIYTEDAREYLRYVFNQYYFPADIHFGHLFSGGKTLAYYANTARQETNNSDVYGNGVLDTESPRSQETDEGGNTYTNSLTYYTWDNHQTTFASQGTKRIADAMNDQDWDIVIIQSHDIEQAFGHDYNKNFKTNLEYLTNYIKSFDPTVEIGWYMTWRRNDKAEGFPRLQDYWNTMKEIVEKNENVSFVVPIGTAVENARGTYINQFNYRPESQSNIAKVNLLTGQSIGSTMTPDNNNGIQRDETHMSAVVGRFLAGYTMGEMLVKHINGLRGAQFTNKTPIEQIYSYDPKIGLLPTEYVQTIKACADAAMASSYTVTQLTDHKTDPVQAVKSLVEAADFTNTEWNETAIKAKAETVLAEKAGAKVTAVNIADNTATVKLRYGYSTIDAHCQRNIEPPTVDVSFDSNCGSVDPTSKTVKIGEPYGELPVPTRTGYDFLGWFTAAEEGDQVTANTVVTATTDHTLYAQWKERTYKVVAKLYVNGQPACRQNTDFYTYEVSGLYGGIIDFDTIKADAVAQAKQIKKDSASYTAVILEDHEPNAVCTTYGEHQPDQATHYVKVNVKTEEKVVILQSFEGKTDLTTLHTTTAPYGTNVVEFLNGLDLNVAGYTLDTDEDGNTNWYKKDSPTWTFDEAYTINGWTNVLLKYTITPHNIYAFARLNSAFAPLTNVEIGEFVKLNDATLTRLGLGSYNTNNYISIGMFSFNKLPLTGDDFMSYYGDEEFDAVVAELADNIVLETGVSKEVAEKIAWTYLFKADNSDYMTEAGYPADDENGYQLSGNLDLATVMFKAGGDNVEGMPAVNYTYDDIIEIHDFYFDGDPFTLPADPTREGYIFEGWSVEVIPAENDADCYDADGANGAADETLLKAGATYTITEGGVIFTAQWKLNTHIIASDLRINGNETVKETGKTYSWTHRYDETTAKPSTISRCSTH